METPKQQIYLFLKISNSEWDIVIIQSKIGDIRRLQTVNTYQIRPPFLRSVNSKSPVFIKNIFVNFK